MKRGLAGVSLITMSVLYGILAVIVIPICYYFGVSALTQNGNTWTGTESWSFTSGRNDTYYFQARDRAGNKSGCSFSGGMVRQGKMYSPCRSYLPPISSKIDCTICFSSK